MNEQLQQALTDILVKATSAADKASEFIIAETPEVVQQILTWYLTYNLIMLIAGICLLIAWVFIEKAVYKYCMTETDDPMFFYGVVFSMARAPLVVVLYHSINLQWLKIWMAPKLWLIEYASSLVK